MIRELSVRPKPKNNYARGLFICLLATALGVFILYLNAEKYKGLIGLVIIALVTGAVFVYTKYVSQSYAYDITYDSEGSAVFVVRGITGKRQSTLCRVDLHSITAVKKETREQMKAHKTEPGYRRYVYTPTLFAPEVYRICVLSRYEKAEILIECTDEFCEYLLSASAEARELYSEDEE